VEQLTGIRIESLEDAKRACSELHKMGPRLVFITSLELGDDTMAILASEQQIGDDDKTTTVAWRINCPILPGHFTGTGDLCASLLLAHSALQPNNLPAVMEKVINTMFAVLERTHAAAGESVQSRELKLIQSKDLIENPPCRFRAERID